jgi:hypothetical protein
MARTTSKPQKKASPNMFGSETKERIKEELVKCARNPVYFIDNYCRVQHKIRGLVPFKLYPFQKSVLEDMRRNEFLIVNKSRQVGMSTLSAGYIIWLMLFQSDKKVLVMAQKQDGANNVVQKVRLMYDFLPDWLKSLASITLDNVKTFELSNRSVIKSTATTADAGRSEAVSLLVIDEAGIIENMDDTWTAIWPTLSSGKNAANKFNGVRCIILSSPKGTGNFFHSMFVQAEAGTNGFKPITLPWYLVPEYDEEWFEAQKAALGDPRKIAQEYECSFVGSGNTVIGTAEIERLKTEVKEPTVKTGMDSALWIWEDFQPGRTYLIASDVARGDADDFSTMMVLDCNKGKIVAEYKAKIQTDRFSAVLASVGRAYGKATIVVEENGPGWAVLDNLANIEKYDNIFYKRKTAPMPNEMVQASWAQYDDSCSRGFKIDVRSRDIVIAKLEEVIRNKQIDFYSKRFVNELETFIYRNGRPEATKGYNDDLCMCAAILCWVYIFNFYKHLNKDGEILSEYTGPRIFPSRTLLDSRIKGQPAIVPMVTSTSNYPSNSAWRPLIRIG